MNKCTTTPATEPATCKHILVPGQALCLNCGERILFTGLERTQHLNRTRALVTRFLDWLSPSETHCVGCGEELPEPARAGMCSKCAAW
jgi:hypothetical protein